MLDSLSRSLRLSSSSSNARTNVLSRLLCLACLAIAFLPRVDALYFYLKAGEQKCFLEELPNHTIVVGAYWEKGALEDGGAKKDWPGMLTWNPGHTGQYKAEEWSQDEARYILNDQLGIQINVEVSPCLSLSLADALATRTHPSTLAGLL